MCLNLSRFSYILSIREPGIDKNAYYHEFFLRGKPLLANQIKRVPLKGTRPYRADCARMTPDLYALPSLEGGTRNLSCRTESVANHAERAQSALLQVPNLVIDPLITQVASQNELPIDPA